MLCRDCRGLFSPQPNGGAAVPLPDHIVVEASRGRFAIVLKSFFVTFGAAPSDLVFQLERDAFSWSEPTDLGPLRLEATLCSVLRNDLSGFAWRRFGRRTDAGEHEVVSDLVLVARDDHRTRAGFSFPARFVAGPSMATLLQWAHDTWFGDGSAYRSAGAASQRAMISVFRKGGRIEALDAKRT